MSGIGDVAVTPVTIEYLKKNYSARIDDSFTGLVTLTSVSAQLSEVTPGCLYVPCHAERASAEGLTANLEAAVERGAYAIVLPEALPFRINTSDVGIPVLFAPAMDAHLGELAAYMAGEPSESIAVFVVFGHNAQAASQKVATLLHILGNPVGLISRESSYSLNRAMTLHFPLSAAVVQRTLAVMLEDGVTALAIAADETTLDPHALAGTHIDVSAGLALGLTDLPFGAHYDPETHEVTTGMYSRDLAQVQSTIPLTDEADVTSVSMTLGAGITLDSIRQALSVAEEFSPPTEP